MNQVLNDHEETAKKALLLKRKELKWRLMQASQLQNRAKLEEIRVEANYNKQKMIRIMALANELRAKYIKVAKAAKVAETLYKRTEYQLHTHEKFVADEKMQLTKIAVDCQNIGKQLYGPNYKLVINSNAADEKRLTLKLVALKRRLAELERKASINSPAKRVLAIEKAQAALMAGSRNHSVQCAPPQNVPQDESIIPQDQPNVFQKQSIGSQNLSNDMCVQDHSTDTQKVQVTPMEIEMIPINAQSSDKDNQGTSNESASAIQKRQANHTLMLKLAPFLRSRHSINSILKKNHDGSLLSTNSSLQITSNQQPLASPRLSRLYDLRNSLLKNLASHRLTTRFVEAGIPITDLNYTHNICPNDYICLPDLIGTCTDKNCVYQHQSNYFMTNIDKLVDILSYEPSVTGFASDPILSKEENDNKCRVRLKEYAAKLIAKNPDKEIETIAQNLVKLIRANKLDHDLLTKTRILSKISHPVVTDVMKPSAPETDN